MLRKTTLSYHIPSGESDPPLDNVGVPFLDEGALVLEQASLILLFFRDLWGPPRLHLYKSGNGVVIVSLFCLSAHGPWESLRSASFPPPPSPYRSG